MARRAKQAGLNARMYRHFAVVTLCLTGALAIFADGEKRDAVAGELAKREQRAELKRAEIEKFGKPRLVIHPRQPHASAGFDYGGSAGKFGEPMDRAGSHAQDIADFRPRNSTTRVGADIDYAALGLTRAEFERLDPSEQEALLREFRRLRAGQARSLLQGSLARGGGSALDY